MTAQAVWSYAFASQVLLVGAGGLCPLRAPVIHKASPSINRWGSMQPRRAAHLSARRASYFVTSMASGLWSFFTRDKLTNAISRLGLFGHHRFHRRGASIRLMDIGRSARCQTEPLDFSHCGPISDTE